MTLIIFTQSSGNGVTEYIMRVIFDQQIFSLQEYGGISRYVCSLATSLAGIEGVEAKIIAPFHINTYLEKLPKAIVSGIKVPKIPKMGRVIQQCSFWLAPVYIARFKPEVVHETYYSEISRVPKGSRRVVTVYDMIHEKFSSNFPSNDRTSELKRLATQRADHIICISENTRKDLLEFFDLPEDKVSVVYLGFDKLTPKDTEEININKPYLLYVGQRGGYKNFEGFLRAYASSPWLRSNFNIVCFGGGSFLSNEIKLFTELKLSDDQLIQVNGSDKKLANFYNSAALFVYPSLYEGFGIPPLEAMSLDCPVVCSNNSSIPEVAGNAAEYFDPNDFESMRETIENVLNSPSRQAELIENGHVRCAHFSWQRCADETLSIYRSLI